MYRGKCTPPFCLLPQCIQFLIRFWTIEKIAALKQLPGMPFGQKSWQGRNCTCPHWKCLLIHRLQQFLWRRGSIKSSHKYFIPHALMNKLVSKRTISELICSSREAGTPLNRSNRATSVMEKPCFFITWLSLFDSSIFRILPAFQQKLLKACLKKFMLGVNKHVVAHSPLPLLPN